MNNNSLASYSRLQLAQLGREYMAAGQFIGRTGYAAVRMHHGDEAYKPIAIENWMHASPIYTRRMQHAMGFQGDGVDTIFKGLQLDVGFAHQYFNVHYRVDQHDQGRFWLASCGPLLETEPRGAQAVKTMCHDIEDPTFDATAVATNPRARMRPVHRPPRVPAERCPHCEWQVFIDPQAQPLTEPPGARRLRQTVLATLPIARPAADQAGGMAFYHGPVHEVLHLEQLSHAALVLVCKEFALQFQLLIVSLMDAVSRHYGHPAAQAVADFQMVGAAWAISERLGNWLSEDIAGIDRVMAIVALHPAFQPGEYIGLSIDKTGPDQARLHFSPCPADAELAGYGWFGRLQAGCIDGLQALLSGIDARAVVQAVPNQPRSWDIVLQPLAAPITPPLAVQIAKGTVLFNTRFQDQVQLLDIQ